MKIDPSSALNDMLVGVGGGGVTFSKKKLVGVGLRFRKKNC